jgi:hypothetical protein
MNFPEIPRYVVGALLFGLIWVAIQYTQNHITDLKVLTAHFLVFVVLGSLIGWAVRTVLLWFKGRQ